MVTTTAYMYMLAEYGGRRQITPSIRH